MKNKLQERVSAAMVQANEKGKQIADMARENKDKLVVKIQDENYKNQMKKFNPVFPADYESEAFSMPYMIVITDDTDRKDIEVCSGAIGWKSRQKDMDILHLYDNAVDFSGLKFIPTPVKGSFYYVDDLDRGRYIKLDTYFDTMQEAMVAELANIAFALGAKSYSVDLQESATELITDKKKASFNAKIPFGNKKDKQEANVSSENNSQIKKRTNITNKSIFSTGAPPEHPNLKIFKNNELINGLIDMRLKSYMNNNKMGGYSIEIKKSSYTSINKSVASNIDAAVKRINVKAKFEMEQKRSKIEEQILVYQIEF